MAAGWHMARLSPVVTGKSARKRQRSRWGTWPIPGGGGHPRTFGNAVENVLDVFAHIDAPDALNLPDWDLDGDRGLAHLTWVFTGPYHLNGVSIGPEP